MGIRSDVGFCMKNKVYQGLSDKTKETIKERFGEFKERSEEGLFFFADSLKWYHESHGDLIQLYSELSDAEDDDYLIIQACGEYPTDDEGDMGGWYGNPWEMYKAVSVSLEWEPRA